MRFVRQAWMSDMQNTLSDARVFFRLLRRKSYVPRTASLIGGNPHR
jgi:hypothetical protein